MTSMKYSDDGLFHRHLETLSLRTSGTCIDNHFRKAPDVMSSTRLLNDQRGATAIEYGLIVAIIAVASVPAIQWMGDLNNQRAQKAAYGLGEPATP
jgi:Flp pilus assembly pilin Flp